MEFGALAKEIRPVDSPQIDFPSRGASAGDHLPLGDLFADVIAGIEVGVLILDLVREDIVSVNAAGQQVLRQFGLEADYRTIKDLMLPELADGEIQPINKRGAQVQVEDRLLGYSVYQVCTAAVCIMMRDITERARLESIVQEVNLMENTGYLFSCLRHEIGNPLNAVKTTLGVLKQNLEQYSEQMVRESLERSLSDIGRIESLLRTMKSYNLFEHPSSSSVNLEDVGGDLARLLKDQFEAKNISSSLKFAEGAREAWVDPRAIHQVLLNILINAMEALDGCPNPLVELETKPGEDGFVILDVKDNGRGMTQEQQKNLFRPFYTSKPGGSGLGLAIVRRMLAKMGGSIQIKSQRNVGTSVSIMLPVNRETSGIAVKRQNPAVGGKG